MARRYLVNSIRIGTRTWRASTLIDDVMDDPALLQANGGVLFPESDVVVAAAALIAQDRLEQGAGIDEVDSLMFAAACESSLAVAQTAVAAAAAAEAAAEAAEAVATALTPLTGADLTDADQTLTFAAAQYTQRVSITADRRKTVNPAGLTRDGIGMVLYRLDDGAHAWTVANGGPAGGDLFVAAAGEHWSVSVRYNAVTGNVELGIALQMP